MSFPYLFESTFELGGVTEWTSETDVDAKLNVRSYVHLAKMPFVDFVPYEGAYAAHIDLSLGTNDAYLQEDTGFDTAANGDIAVRLYVWVGQLTMAASDRFTVFALQSGAGTDEATIGIINNAGTIQWVFAETGATALGAATRTTDVIQNAWHCLEMVCNIDAGGGNDGTLAAYVDGYQIGATITGLDQAVITQARMGAIGIDAGTTAGHLLFDAVVADDTRVGTLGSRFGAVRRVTKSGHVALGPGRLRAAALFAAAAGDTLTLWDTDRADVTDQSRIIYGPIQNTGVQDTFRDFNKGMLYFTRGVYAELAGTTPRASITVDEAIDMSFGGIKMLGNVKV